MKYQNDEKTRELFYKGLKDSEIAKILSIRASTVWLIRKRLDLIRAYPLSENPPVKLTKKQEEILIGHLFGDGSLEKTTKNARGKIEQGEKQKLYALWKYKNLENLCSTFTENRRSKIDPRTGKYYKSYGARLKSNPELNNYYSIFYLNNKKIITEQALNLYTPMSLAVHYMDDGSKETQGGYRLATNCFSMEEIVLFQKFLWDRFSLETTIHKGNMIYIKKGSSKLFKRIIEPYIIDSMKYKLHKS